MLANRVARNCNVPASATYVTTKIFEYLNRRYKTIYRAHFWPKTIQFYTIAVPAYSLNATGGAVVTLPKYIGPVLRMVNNTSGDVVYLIDPAAFSDKTIAIRNLFRTFLELEEDTPVGTHIGTSNVLCQPAITVPATSVILSVKSSASESVTNIPVFIRGLDANNEIISEAVTVTGTTQVTTANSYSMVNAVSKTGQSNGIISLLDPSANILATLSTWEVSPEYQTFSLEVVDNTNPSLIITAQRAFAPFLNSADIPAFEMDECLVNGATADAFLEQEKEDLAAHFEQKYTNDLSKMVRTELEQSSGAMLCLPLGRA